MATRTEHALVCDNPLGLHRPHAEVPAVVTRRLGWGGREYELDLCAAESAALDREVTGFVEHARPVKARVRRQRDRSPERRRHTVDVRAWAKGRGLVVGDRGRIPVSVWDEYEQVHGE